MLVRTNFRNSCLRIDFSFLIFLFSLLNVKSFSDAIIEPLEEEPRLVPVFCVLFLWLRFAICFLIFEIETNLWFANFSNFSHYANSRFYTVIVCSFFLFSTSFSIVLMILIMFDVCNDMLSCYCLTLSLRVTLAPSLNLFMRASKRSCWLSLIPFWNSIYEEWISADVIFAANCC